MTGSLSILDMTCSEGNSFGCPRNSRNPALFVNTDPLLTLKKIKGNDFNSFHLSKFRSMITSRPLSVPGLMCLVASFWTAPALVCIFLTRRLNFDSLRSSCRLKAQQTPESVITGLKISEQLTSLPCHLCIGCKVLTNIVSSSPILTTITEITTPHSITCTVSAYERIQTRLRMRRGSKAMLIARAA